MCDTNLKLGSARLTVYQALSRRSTSDAHDSPVKCPGSVLFFPGAQAHRGPGEPKSCAEGHGRSRDETEASKLPIWGSCLHSGSGTQGRGCQEGAGTRQTGRGGQEGPWREHSSTMHHRSQTLPPPPATRPPAPQSPQTASKHTHSHAELMRTHCTPVLGLDVSPQPTQSRQHSAHTDPESFHVVDFIQGLTSSPSTGECRKRPLDLRSFWTLDSQISDPVSSFSQRKYGVGRTKRVERCREWRLRKGGAPQGNGGGEGVLAAQGTTR